MTWSQMHWSWCQTRWSALQHAASKAHDSWSPSWQVPGTCCLPAEGLESVDLVKEHSKLLNAAKVKTPSIYRFCAIPQAIFQSESSCRISLLNLATLQGDGDCNLSRVFRQPSGAGRLASEGHDSAPHSALPTLQRFTGVVKIRKGLTARLIVACCDGPDAVQLSVTEFRRRAGEACDESRSKTEMSAHCTTWCSTRHQSRGPLLVQIFC